MPNTIVRESNRLTFSTLSDPRVPVDFIKAVHEGQQLQYMDYILDFARVGAVFPNTAAPLAGLLRYYQDSLGIAFRYEHVPPYIERTSTLAPMPVDGRSSTATDTVWRFASSSDANSLTNSFIDAVARSAVCEPGVLNAISFCVFEVLDNVLLHASSDSGYVMAQIHPTAQHIALCIYDTGQGIYNSLRESHGPTSAINAIEMALRKGVTSGKGAGFGLWGLHSIVASNSGRLTIGSGSGLYILRGAAAKVLSHVPFLSPERNGTLVDFQIDFASTINVAEALGNYEPIDFFIDNLEDEAGIARVQVSQLTSGVGTRAAGAEARNQVLNIDKLATGRVVLDFEHIEHMSSSFADEFVAKVVQQCGIDRFRQRFAMVNRGTFVADVIDRAIANRMGASSLGDS